MRTANRATHKPETAHQALRRETSAVHERLHVNGLLEQLEAEVISRADYRVLMQRFLDYYACIDPILIAANSRFSSDLREYSYAPRAPHIAVDVGNLMPATGEAFQGAGSINQTATIAEPQCLAEFAGIVYVLEGSLLGGSQLHKSAQSVLASNVGCSYWLWCKQNGAQRWAATRSLIDHVGATSVGRQTMIATANATFAELESELA